MLYFCFGNEEISNCTYVTLGLWLCPVAAHNVLKRPVFLCNLRIVSIRPSVVVFGCFFPPLFGLLRLFLWVVRAISGLPSLKKHAVFIQLTLAIT